MKVRSKDFNFSKATPTKVSDMKNGEWRLGENGLYGRVGNQILTKEWPLYQTFGDEFNDQSMDTEKWNPIALQQGATYEEAADGTLTVTFSGNVNVSSLASFTHETGLVTDKIPAGVGWGLEIRFQVLPLYYTPNQTSYGDDTMFFKHFQNYIWDDQIYWEFDCHWCCGSHPSGMDMYGFESCYIFTSDISDEYNAEWCRWGPSVLIPSGRADYATPFPVDETHNGWFTYRFTKSAAGVIKQELQPDGNSNWYDITAPGIVPYDLDVGGKAGTSWGTDLYMREVMSWGSPPPTSGPSKVDYIRAFLII